MRTARVRRRVHRSADEPPPCPKSEAVPFDASAPLASAFLIACTSGVLVYRNRSLRRILDGRFYGLASRAGRWYGFVAGTSGESGRLISFELRDDLAQAVRVEVQGLHPAVHQISESPRGLWVTDTGNNRLLEFDVTASGLIPRRAFYPNGWFKRQRLHLNSVSGSNGVIRLMFHNLTALSGRWSQIAEYDDHLRLRRLIDTGHAACHNIEEWRGSLVYCGSRRGVLRVGDVTIPLGHLTRGLAFTDDLILVGGSTLAARHERAGATGYVFAVDAASLTETARLTIPGTGGIHEIRCLDRP